MMNTTPGTGRASSLSGPVAHAFAPAFEREYLTTEEAADLLGLRPQTLRKA